MTAERRGGCVLTMPRRLRRMRGTEVCGWRSRDIDGSGRRRQVPGCSSWRRTSPTEATSSIGGEAVGASAPPLLGAPGPSPCSCARCGFLVAQVGDEGRKTPPRRRRRGARQDPEGSAEEPEASCRGRRRPARARADAPLRPLPATCTKVATAACACSRTSTATSWPSTRRSSPDERRPRKSPSFVYAAGFFGTVGPRSRCGTT